MKNNYNIKWKSNKTIIDKVSLTFDCVVDNIVFIVVWILLEEVWIKVDNFVVVVVVVVGFGVGNGVGFDVCCDVGDELYYLNNFDLNF